MINIFKSKRKKLLEREIPEAWESILAEHMPQVLELPPEQDEAFRNRLKIFVWEKQWIGAGDLEVTEEMKVVIGATAARIARCLPLEVYDRVREVVVYPFTFQHPEDAHEGMLGQMHHWGTVILSWPAVLEGLERNCDGRNTAIHEFAHALDLEDGVFDGTPLLEEGRDYEPWMRVMGEHFERLQEHPDHAGLDSYGAMNEAEFFAVATEAFFETPRTLADEAPDLYRELCKFFNVSPVDLETPT